MLERIWQKLRSKKKQQAQNIVDERVGASGADLDIHYNRLNKNARLADSIFDHLRASIFDLVEQKQADQVGGMLFGRVFLEHGQLEDGRRYFYLKPGGEHGWLFERSGAGWVISHSEKIVEQSMFLRSNEPWDIVTLHKPHIETASVRIKSLHLGQEALSFPIYKKLMLEAISDSFTQPLEMEED